jgi:hypothetical protein
MDNLFDQKRAELIPFHALNEFMRNDYRLEVVRSTLNGLGGLPSEFRGPIDRLTKKHVKVPGFRHSDKAPLAVRINPTADAFEKQPHMVAEILRAWAELHPELRRQVFDLLVERGWQVLPLEADRTKLPGFFIRWPKGEDFQVVNEAYKEKYPEAEHNVDDTSLMIVWVSMRLPYLHEGEDDAGGEEAAGTGTAGSPFEGNQSAP